jgi:hypothetical protein
MCQDFNEMFNYRIKFKFNLKNIYIYIKIMKCKIMRSKVMWRNIMRSTKSKKKFWFYITSL